MHSPWLSVLVPVYRVEAYLEACVASVLDQGEHGVEILLLDDASPDRSGEIARALQARHPDVVRVLAHAHNRGLSAARNTLLGEARGRYLWFLDSDDLLLPGALRGLRAAVEGDAPDLVLCDFRVVRERFGLKHRLRGERHRRTFAGPAGVPSSDRAALIEGLLARGQLHSWSKIATAEVWRQARFPEGRYFEDIAVIPALLGASRRYRYVAAPWVGYRQREDSILADYSPPKIRDLLMSARELHDGLLALPEAADPRVRFAVAHYCLKACANAARRAARLRQPDAGLDAVGRAACAAMFPQGLGPVLRDGLRRGWWLRAWRSARSLRRTGWLA